MDFVFNFRVKAESFHAVYENSSSVAYKFNIINLKFNALRDGIFN